MKIEIKITNNNKSYALAIETNPNLIGKNKSTAQTTAEDIIKNMIANHSDFHIMAIVISSTDEAINRQKPYLKIIAVYKDDGKWKICHDKSTTSENTAANFKTIDNVNENEIHDVMQKIAIDYISE